jgi:hypothetical protein
MDSTAPLMTEESNPNRKPPTAAAMARPIALRAYGLRAENASAGIAPELLTLVTIATRARVAHWVW